MQTENKITGMQLNEIGAGFSLFGVLESGAHWGLDNKRNITYILQGDAKRADEILRNEKAFVSNQTQGVRESILKKIPNDGWLGKFCHNVL